MRISDWSSDVCSSDLSHPDEGDGDAVDRGGDGAVDRRVAAGAVERFAGERRHQFGAAEPGGARLVLAPCEDGAPDAAAGESGIGDNRANPRGPAPRIEQPALAQPRREHRSESCGARGWHYE